MGTYNQAAHLAASTVAIKRYTPAEIARLRQQYITARDALAGGSKIYSPEEVAAARERFVLGRARSSLVGFAATVWEQSVGKKFHLNWHHELLFEEVERAVLSASGRLICNIPPRYGKTEIASKLAPAWLFGINPSIKIFGAAATEELASDYGREILEFMSGDVYKRIFPNTVLSPQSQSKKKFATRQGGTYLAFGVGNNPRGRGADVFIYDDPHRQLLPNVQETDEVYENIYEWFKENHSRLEGDGSYLIMHTRFHISDLTGQLLKEEKERIEEVGAEAARLEEPPWRHLSLPELLEGTRFSEKGECLWPDVRPLRTVMTRKRRFNHEQFQAQCQQEPVVGGGLSRILPENWKVLDVDHDNLPKMEYIFQSYDPAYTVNKESNYTGYVELGLVEQKKKDNKREFYVVVLDAQQIKLEVPELQEWMLENWERRREYHENLIVLVEGRGVGDAVVQELKHTMPNIQLIKPSGTGIKGGRNTKENRLESVVSFWRKGLVYFPRGADYKDLIIDQFSSFPGGKNDDICDATTQALSMCRAEMLVRIESDFVVRNKEYDDEEILEQSCY